MTIDCNETESTKEPNQADRTAKLKEQRRQKVSCNNSNEIEHFVEERSVGADAWRRTGMLIFDGNKAVEQKVTYERIRQHLEKKYGCHFSYGTTVELCVARNRRRKSAKRYKGAAQVTS